MDDSLCIIFTCLCEKEKEGSITQRKGIRTQAGDEFLRRKRESTRGGGEKGEEEDDDEKTERNEQGE